MRQSDDFDNLSDLNPVNEENGHDPENDASFDGVSSDPYASESREDIYDTPDIIDVEPKTEETESVSAEPVVDAEVVSGGPYPNGGGQGPYGENPYGVNPYRGNPNGNDPYGGSPNGNNPYGGNPYGNNSYGNDPYGGNPNGNNPYGGNPYGNNPYGGNPNGNNPYGGNPYGNNSYGNNPYGGSPNGNDPYGGNPYGNNSYGNNPYGGSPNGNNSYNGNPNGNVPYGNSYGKNPYGNNQYGNGPYGGSPYGNNPYSPFAAPPKKNKSGLIIGIVAVVIILFLIAIFALVYRAVELYVKDADDLRNSREEYDFDDDDWGNDHRDRYDDYDDYDYDDYGYDDYDYDDYDYDDYDDYDYDDHGDDDYNYDDPSNPYYTLHDSIRNDLSYSVDFAYEEHEQETGNDNVDIEFLFPVIYGDEVPNLDQLNATIKSEIDSLYDFYEQEFEGNIGENDYYQCSVMSYVTYMDEEKMSIVLDERIYSTYYNYAYLYCLNIDMEHGVVLDNDNMLSLDDEFSIEFREKNEIQNGANSSIDMMSDQQITGLFNSDDVIVFYTPLGMEIGFNYDEGWVTVTYKEYEQYLKVF